MQLINKHLKSETLNSIIQYCLICCIYSERTRILIISGYKN